MSDVLAPLARRLGWTSGQAWTAVPGLVVAVPVLVVSLIGVLGQSAPAPVSPVAVPAPVSPPAQPDVPTQPALSAAPAAPDGGDTLTALPAPFLSPAAAFAPSTTAADEPTPKLLSPTRPTSPAPPRPLSVVAAGWTSTVGDDASVPAGDLPVQAGPGGEVAHAFARLAGQGAVLLLAVDDTPGAGFGAGLGGGVLACANLSSTWQPGRGQAPSAAPAFDPDRCVTGALAGGTYAFDLDGLPDITGAGISFLADPAGPLPYRIALRTTLEEL